MEYQIFMCHIWITMSLPLLMDVLASRSLQSENELIKNSTLIRHRLHHRISVYPYLAKTSSIYYGYGSLFPHGVIAKYVLLIVQY